MTQGASGTSATLADIDWKVHQVLESDKVANIQEPLVRLQLYLKEPSVPADTQHSTKEVSIELTKPELDQLISQLEGAKGALSQVKEQAPSSK